MHVPWQATQYQEKAWGHAVLCAVQNTKGSGDPEGVHVPWQVIPIRRLAGVVGWNPIWYGIRIHTMVDTMSPTPLERILLSTSSILFF